MTKNKKRKREKPPLGQKQISSLNDLKDEEDVEIGQEDVEFFQENVDFSNFLVNLDSSALSKVQEFPHIAAKLKEKKKRTRESEDEAEYEKAPRNYKAEKEYLKLPIKPVDGAWKLGGVFDEVDPEYSDVELESAGIPNEVEDSDFAQSLDNLDKNDICEEQQPRPVEKGEKASLEPSKDDNYHQKLEKIAALSTKITENPMEFLDKLKLLRQYAKDTDHKIAKLSLLSQVAIFTDIIPGYKIRELTDKEKKMKVSKDVKQLREYEEGIVTNYHQFIKILENILGNKREKPGLVEVAVKCTCEMLISASHFNYRGNLMNLIVSKMNIVGSGSKDIGEICCHTVSKIFTIDERGDVSLQLVKLIAKLLKNHPKSRPRVIETFLSLNFSSEIKKREVKMERIKLKKYLSRKNKKQKKITDEVEKEMKEARATLDQEEKLATQSEILKYVFVCYFRIIKSRERSKSMFLAALDGVSKFGYLINFQYHQDLEKVINDVLADHNLRERVIEFE